MPTVNNIIESKKSEFEKVVDHLRSELTIIRTGRASTSLVEMLPVEAYGSTQPLRDLAQISVPEPRQILIQPWDKSIAKDVEKAIQTSKLGINPTNEGGVLRVVLPQLTEERRKELTKVVGQYEENSRIALRNVRENILKELKSSEENGDISEDERYRGEELLQKEVDQYNDKIKEIASKKEQEIMQV